MMVAVIVLSAFTFLPGSSTKGDITFEETELVNVDIKPKQLSVKPPVRQSVVNPVSAGKFLSRIIIVDKTESADVLQNIEELAIGSNTNIVLNGTGPQIIMPAADGNDAGPAVAIVEAVDKITPLETAEVMPEYPGGLEALRKFLVRNLNNPRDMEDGELVSVKIKFVVGFDGKLKGFELLQDGGNEFNEEVIRVLKKMPAWIPGKSRGQNVSVYYAIPVKFVGQG
ncbi:MAG: energy transducer TonB [Ferruginibacter sp.]|nr:energy transducer TonB [Ferruginibacter sp.]